MTVIEPWVDWYVDHDECVPRRLMPQIAHHDLSRLITFARQNQVWARRDVVLSTQLLHHQNVKWDPKQWNPLYDHFPILIASDFYILDGNHRAYANRVHKKASHIIQFGLPFEPAIALLFHFPKTTTIETIRRRVTGV